ncbi:MAG: alpha/beta fold hydrolase [Flavobacteriaceae bacterium]|nr:alpha/beta fold hydrolase [Flavobacteriaceae bacterium]
MGRKILKYLSILLALIILVLLGLYIIPPKQETIEYDYAEIERNPLVNSKIGWYEAKYGKNYQITWGAKQGLQLNLFDFDRDNIKSLRLKKIKENEYDTNNDPNTVEVRFKFNAENTSWNIDVNTSKTKLQAIKRDSLFYDQEEIEFYNGAQRLAGLLLTPYKNTKSVALVLIHGSGISDRDNFWYMHQAHYLASNGFIVLLPDKRGCGKSNGEWHTASFDDFASDISSALNYLLTNKQSEFNRMGVIGLSQGGWISHIVNQNNKDLDFVIDVVASTTSPNEQVKFEVMNEIKNSGVPEFIANPLSLVFAKRAQGKRRIWWDKNGEFDPIPLISKTTTPVLKIFADQDENVPVQRSLERLNELLKNNPDLPVDVKIFKGSSHALFDSETNWIRRDYLDYLIFWISKI